MARFEEQETFVICLILPGLQQRYVKELKDQ